MRQLDVLFINPNASEKIYQDLSKDFSAYEPPIWAMLLAGKCRSQNFGVEILDAEVEGLNYQQVIDKIVEYNPRLVVFVSYGQQPSSSTQNMEGIIGTAKLLKEQYPKYPIMAIGGHISALPMETLAYNCLDFIAQDEGSRCLVNLLKTDLSKISDLQKVQSLGFKSPLPCLNERSPQLSNILDEDLPDLAYDLIPIHKYRTALWHSYPNKGIRQPFMSLYTSLNCPYSCSFCCISAPFGKPGIKHWSKELNIKYLEKFAELGIVNIKVADELALLKQSGFLELVKLIIERGLKFNFWAYGRADSTKPEWLEELKQAGVNYIALGIENPNQQIRNEVIKGQYKEVKIDDIVHKIEEAGIEVAANYIFGLPTETQETMQSTLDFAISLNTSMANFYCAMAYPGSKLYTQAVAEKIELPNSYSGYSQHSYDMLPLRTEKLSAADIVRFRDNAWQKYHSRPEFLNKIQEKFGNFAYQQTVDSLKIKLKRKLLGD